MKWLRVGALLKPVWTNQILYIGNLNWKYGGQRCSVNNRSRSLKTYQRTSNFWHMELGSPQNISQKSNYQGRQNNKNKQKPNQTNKISILWKFAKAIQQLRNVYSLKLPKLW